MDLTDSAVEDIVLKKETVAVALRLRRAGLHSLASSLESEKGEAASWISDEVCLQFRAFLYSKTGPDVRHHDHVQRPKDWWAAFKLRWFPLWALRRWPAELESIPTRYEETRVCPHLALDGADDRLKPVHIAWLDRRDGYRLRL